MNQEIIKTFSLNLRMGIIESGPPLSTILGNFGINTVKFCKELNEFTTMLPNYFILEVKVIIYTDKSYIFFICEPTVAMLLKLVSFKIDIPVKISGGLKSKSLSVVKLKDLFLISYFKFGISNDENLIKSIYGTLMSLNYYVVK